MDGGCAGGSCGALIEIVGAVYSTRPGSGAILAVQLILHQMIYLQPICFCIPITVFQLENIRKIVDQLKVFGEEKQRFL